MGVIRERKNNKGETSYSVIIRRKGHPSISKTFRRKTDAKIWEQQMEADMFAGRFKKASVSEKHTLADLIDRYIKYEVPKRGNDKQKMITHLSWWKNQIGALYLSEVTHFKLAEYRDKLLNEPNMRNGGKISKNRKKLYKRKSTSADNAGEEVKTKSPSTVNRYLASLSVAFSTAEIEWGWIEINPMRKVRKAKEGKGRERYLGEEEHLALLNACKDSLNPYLYTIVIAALSTGARFSEIMNLTWKDINFKERLLTFYLTKNGETRSVHISDILFQLLFKLRQVRRIDSPYVFPSANGRKPLDIRDAWNFAVKRAGLIDFRFHDLRHSAASYLAMNGCSELEIAAILGHKTLEMVKRYSHLNKKHTAGILERMNDKQFRTYRESNQI